MFHEPLSFPPVLLTGSVPLQFSIQFTVLVFTPSGHSAMSNISTYCMFVLHLSLLNWGWGWGRMGRTSAVMVKLSASTPLIHSVSQWTIPVIKKPQHLVIGKALLVSCSLLTGNVTSVFLTPVVLHVL